MSSSILIVGINERRNPTGQCPRITIVFNIHEYRIGDTALLLQYADDTTLVCSGPVTASVMNQQLALIHDWLVEHRMRLNVQKSRVMWFRVGRRKLQHLYPHISIDGVTLQTTEQQIYLGLNFDTLVMGFSGFQCFKKMSYYYISLSPTAGFLNLML